MFSLLNIAANLRKYSPLVCKFLDIVTGISHARLAAPRRRSYLVERLSLRNYAFAAIGLPIALRTRPALIYFREGKG
jgi:hypothetical protein